MLGLESGGIVLHILMSDGFSPPEPEVSTHGYGILVTVFRKWLAPDALTVVEECVRQYLGVRLNKVTLFWFDGVAAVRDAESCRGLAGTDPMERSAGLGCSVGIRYHDKLLSDVVRLCAALRSKVPSSTAIICVLIPEATIPRAAMGQRGDPNGAAWLLAEALELSRVILYTCVAASGWSRLHEVEGHVSLRLQLVYSGPDEMFSHLTGECPHPLLSPEIEDGVDPAVITQKAGTGNASLEIVVSRPNPPCTPLGDGCGWRAGGRTETSVGQHLLYREGDAVSPAPLVPRLATPDDLRRSSSPARLTVAALTSTQAVP